MNNCISFSHVVLGQAETIDSPYIKEGKTLDVNVYAKSKKGLGKIFAGILSPFK